MSGSPQVGDGVELPSHVVSKDVGQVVVLEARREVGMDLDALRSESRSNLLL